MCLEYVENADTHAKSAMVADVSPVRKICYYKTESVCWPVNWATTSKIAHAYHVTTIVEVAALNQLYAHLVTVASDWRSRPEPVWQ